MPEAADVVLIARRLPGDLVGRFITSVSDTAAAAVPPEGLPLQITGSPATWGKKLLLPVAGDMLLVADFGLQGDLACLPFDITDPPFTLWWLCLDDGRRLVLTDPMRMCTLRRCAADATSLQLGPDLLQTVRGWSDDKLVEHIRRSGRSRNFCSVLLDQTIVAGVGNYMKSEMLHAAGVRDPANVKVPHLTDAQIVTAYRYGVDLADRIIAANPPAGQHGVPALFKVYQVSGTRVVKVGGRHTYVAP